MNRLKELRKQKSLTLVELGKEVNLANNTLSQYERGIREPSISMLIKLADFFNVTVDYLIGRESAEKLKAEDGWHYYTINDFRLSEPMWVHDEDSEDDYVQVLSDYELKMLEECLILGETLAEQLDYLHEKYITHEIGERSYEKITRVMIECEFYVKARRPVNVDS